MQLATFVQMSDLHIGDVNPHTLDAATDAFWAYSKHFDGLLGHSHGALVRIDRFVQKLRREENARLVVTGDLTAWGANDQFDTAAQFLAAELVPPLGRNVGLRTTAWQEYAVSGNHDHWPGSPDVTGPSTAGLRKYFPDCPFVRDPLVLSSGHKIRFMGIDTDADVSDHGFQRSFARGSFESQLTSLSGKLDPREDDEIRVLLLHHSRSWSGVKLGIEHNSRSALDTFISNQDISVLLSGHIHVPRLDRFDLSALGRTISVLEARCGTTTQMSTIPLAWRNLLRRRPTRELPPNTVIVHRIIQDEGTLIWRAKVFIETSSAFAELQDDAAKLTLPGDETWDTATAMEIQIWPRP